MCFIIYVFNLNFMSVNKHIYKYTCTYIDR